MSGLIAKLEDYQAKGLMNRKLVSIIQEFYDSYQRALAGSPQSVRGQQLFEQLVELTLENIHHPFSFAIFHRGIRHPFDYYQFGLDFIRPFVDFSQSKLFGLTALQSIQAQLKRGDNVILFANHQTEPDPPIISLLLETIDPSLAFEIIFVAGDRVISDPLAIPMSLGRNLLCIYSKKHISYPPQEKAKKIAHNQRTLKTIQELLNQGGQCIYVAPSGGRDRPNTAGQVEPAPFDAQSIELFWLVGQRAARPTHFYPMALKTYHLMPPPQQVEQELGEQRVIHVSPVYLAFGEEIDREHFSSNKEMDKKIVQEKRAEYIWNQVCALYQSFPQQ